MSTKQQVASYRFVVRGKVQGVFFRQSTVQQAQKLQLRGWVRNRADGAVEGVAQGDAAALATLRNWLDSGPPAAQVEQVQWQLEPNPMPLQGFTVCP